MGWLRIPTAVAALFCGGSCFAACLSDGGGGSVLWRLLPCGVFVEVSDGGGSDCGGFCLAAHLYPSPDGRGGIDLAACTSPGGCCGLFLAGVLICIRVPTDGAALTSRRIRVRRLLRPLLAACISVHSDSDDCDQSSGAICVFAFRRAKRAAESRPTIVIQADNPAANYKNEHTNHSHSDVIADFRRGGSDLPRRTTSGPRDRDTDREPNTSRVRWGLFRESR